MCLITKQTKPLIAKNSITAYKIIQIIGDEYISPYMCYNYTKFIKEHKMVQDVIPIVEHKNIYGEQMSRYVRINKGLHLFLSKDFAKYTMKLRYPGKYILFKCRIPKDSYYFTSKNNVYICTNQFEFIEEVDKETRDIFEDIEADYWINEQNNNGCD